MRNRDKHPEDGLRYRLSVEYSRLLIEVDEVPRIRYKDEKSPHSSAYSMYLPVGLACAAPSITRSPPVVEIPVDQSTEADRRCHEQLSFPSQHKSPSQSARVVHKVTASGSGRSVG